MKPEVAERRIQAFRDRFGEAHFILAIHAAFPLALTPDLLYRLWANFQQDIHGELLNIPWLAVADLLLSSLCEEVGHELYEMPKEIRNPLLAELKANPRFGSPRINNLSDFLLTHIQQQLESHDPDLRDFAQAQRWTALAYTQPTEAAREIASTLAALSFEDKIEWIRMTSLVETFAEPLAKFEPLLIYIRSMQDFIRSNVKDPTEEIRTKRGISYPENLSSPFQSLKPTIQPELSSHGAMAAISELLQALQDANSGVRESAATALGNLGSEAAIPGLLQALQDANSGVRESAATALGNLGSATLNLGEPQEYSRVKILIVDDDPSTRNLVSRFLTYQGYDVQSAEDGKTAISIFENFNPALAILDVNLSDCNGFNLCQEMQSRTGLFVIILTHRSDEADRIRGFVVGADDYMTKPFSLGELGFRVGAVLKRQRSVVSKASAG